MHGFEAPIVNNLAPRLLDPAQKQGNYLAKVKWHVEHLTQAMNRLKARRDDHLRLVLDAEARQEIRTNEVRDWIEKVSAMETEVILIQERYNNRSLCCFGCCGVNCWSSYRIGKAAAKKLPKVEKLLADGVFATLTTRPQPQPAEEEPNTHKVVGMEAHLAVALRHIDGDAGIIGIWGMGGVGKTTLLRNINNSFLPGTTRSSDFHHVIWVVASQNLNVNKLRQDIADKLGLISNPRTEAAVRSFLKKKNFLLLLDDLWEPLDLDSIGIPQPHGSIVEGMLKHKVIITTRFMDVCGKMEAHTRLKVECLDWEKSWELFRHKVGDDNINFVGPDLAKDVARECCGLPLALIVIGRAMSTKTEPNDWRFAAAKLREAQHVEISGKEGEKMLNLLKFSYDSLPDDTTRKCFLSCSMWPEDHHIHPDFIIECCMGLDLIDEPNGIHETYMKGHSIITRLKEACLLETVNYDNVHRAGHFVKMHDVIRDLALWIVSDRGKLLVKAGVGLSKLENMSELWRREEVLERISLMWNSIEELPYRFPSLPNLNVLMLQGNPIKKIPSSFFHSIPAITFIDLSYSNIQELPEDIGSLGRLQYLNLSQTKIRTLPKNLASLQKLKHLKLRGTDELSKIPSGMISKLQNLQILDIYSSNYMYWETEDGLKLDELNSKILRALGITINSISALQKLSMMSVSTRQLNLDRVDSLTSTVIRLRPNVISHGFLSMMHNLHELVFSNCRICTELIVEHDDLSERSSTGKDWSMQILENVTLFDLSELVDIRISRRVAAGFFPTLTILKIVSCYKLSNASWIGQLPCLQSLFIVSNTKMIELIEEDVPEEEIRACFPRLQEMHLAHLTVLSSICRRALHFPLLEFISVNRCGKLKRLSIEPEITERKLREIRGETSWWNGLEWDDGDTKATLAPYFFDVWED